MDDDPYVLASPRRVIRPLGHRIFTASDVFQRLQIVSAERLDLILLAVRTPIMDGYEFLSKLQSLGMDDLPVVMLTAVGNLTKGYRAGCVYYMSKPSRARNVRQIVQCIIGDLTDAQRQELELCL